MQQTRCFVRRPRPSLTRPPAPTLAPARPPPPPPPPPAPPAPVSNDIAGILRRMQPRCQRYLCGSQSPASTRPHSSRRLWSSCAPGTLASLPPGGWRGRSRSCPRRRRARTAAAARSRGSCWTHLVVKKQRDKKKEGVCRCASTLSGHQATSPAHNQRHSSRQKRREDAASQDVPSHRHVGESRSHHSLAQVMPTICPCGMYDRISLRVSKRGPCNITQIEDN